MILGFSTHWPKKMSRIGGYPTHFVEKITECLLRDTTVELKDAIWRPYIKLPAVRNYLIGDKKPKKHSIRTDEKDHWKPGMWIHYFIHVRQPAMFRFAPLAKCKSTQKIEIKHLSILSHPLDIQPMVWVDGYLFYDPAIGYDKGIENLAKNDGFDSPGDFFYWFSKDFTGKIIHWTDLKY